MRLLCLLCLAAVVTQGCAASSFETMPPTPSSVIVGVERRGLQPPLQITDVFPVHDPVVGTNYWSKLVEEKGCIPSSRFPECWVKKGLRGKIQWVGEGPSFVLSYECEENSYEETIVNKHGFTAYCVKFSSSGKQVEVPVLFIDPNNAELVKVFTDIPGAPRLYEFVANN